MPSTRQPHSLTPAGSVDLQGPVIDVAALFESTKCRSAMEAANRTDWERMGDSEHVPRAKRIDNLAGGGWKSALYVRNQKAASTFLYTAVDHIFKRPTTELYAKGSAPHGEEAASSAHTSRAGYDASPDTLVFTAVRDPIEVAIAGYMTLTRRSPDGGLWSDPHARTDGSPSGGSLHEAYRKYAHDKYAGVAGSNPFTGLRAVNRSVASMLPHMSFLRSDGSFRFHEYDDLLNLRWRGLDCRDAAHAKKRFEAYLDALEGRAQLSSIAYHVYPQAFKIDFVRRTPRYDAIAKVEDLDAGLKRIAAAAGVQNAKVPPPSTAQAHSTEDLSCAHFELDVPLRRRLCKAYAVDFACFGYKLPFGCGHLQN